MNPRGGLTIDRDSLHASDEYARQVEAAKQLQERKVNADVEKAVEYIVERYPFARCKAEVFDGTRLIEVDSWRPGVELEPCGPYGEDTGAFADGTGKMVLTEVSRHKPGKYPERVFYLRRYITPDGVEFGKPALRIAVASKFRRLCGGYAHEFEMRETDRITAHLGGEQ
jgi:hypothetical protein